MVYSLAPVFYHLLSILIGPSSIVYSHATHGPSSVSVLALWSISSVQRLHSVSTVHRLRRLLHPPEHTVHLSTPFKTTFSRQGHGPWGLNTSASGEGDADCERCDHKGREEEIHGEKVV
jgi:hypothetical protein